MKLHLTIFGASFLSFSTSNFLFAIFTGFRFLGHLYAAEALIKLNRLPEAIMHLSTENINNVTISPPTGAESSTGK